MQTLNLTKKYNRYPEYKDSGVEWLGKIPRTWDVRKVSRSFNLIGSGTTPDSGDISYYDGDINWVQTGDLNDSIVTQSSKKITAKALNLYSALKIYPINSLLIAMYGATIGKTGLLAIEAAVNQACCVLGKSKFFNIHFVYYWFLVNRYKIVDLYSYGSGQPNISQDTIRSLYIQRPSLEEQEKTVEFLDKKIGFIDMIIEKKKKLIELLQEKRTAVINQAVNDISGKFGKIKHFAKINPARQTIGITDIGETVSFVPMEALSETGSLELQERKYEEVKEGFTFFRNGDVVLAKITPCYENGKAGVMKGLKKGFGFGTTEFIIIRPSKEIISDYLYYLIFSDKFRKLGEVEMRGTAGQKRVTNSFVKNYEFYMPKLEVQKIIVDELNKKITLVDLAIVKTDKSIELLQEFKLSLISNVVTGKVRV